MSRRKFIRDSGLLSASLMLPSLARSEDNWSGGQIQHLIPLSNHDRIMLKVSFAEPQQRPSLRIGQRSFGGIKTDTLGRFWTFHAEGLESMQEYELTLEQQGNNMRILGLLVRPRYRRPMWNQCVYWYLLVPEALTMRKLIPEYGVTCRYLLGNACSNVPSPLRRTLLSA